MSKFITLTPTGHNKVLYTYGKDNLLTGMTLNNQKTLNFVYDGIGRPTSHTVNLIHPLTTAYTYHGITSGGTVYKNSLIRTEKIRNGDFWYLYHYDANNNINRLYQNAENEDNKVLLEDYSYDALNQLENVNYYDRHERHEYTYDNGGNITEEKVYDTSGATPVLTTTNTYTYGDNSWGDLLTEYNGDTITYDGIGNPLNYRDGIFFTWGNGRQLQSYTKNNSTINYTYDNNGMRLSKDVGNTHYTYLYQNGLLVKETIGEKILDYSYTSGGKILSVRYKTNASDTGVYYYYAINSRGDVIGLYDHTGALYAKYTYDVWGNPVSVMNATGTEITSPTDFANLQSIRYRSYYYDSETGLYYLQSRYYDPVTHRFINADTLMDTNAGILGYNLFLYSANNPVNISDPSGHWIIKSAIKWISKHIVKPVVKTIQRVMSKIPATYSRGINLSGSPGIFSFNLQGGTSIDTKGNVALQGSFTGGVTTGSGASATLYQSITNAPSIKKLEGPAYQFGGSFGFPVYGVPLSAGGDFNIIPDSELNKTYFGMSTNAGFGTPGLEFHVEWGETATWTITQFNVYEVMGDVYSMIMEW